MMKKVRIEKIIVLIAVAAYLLVSYLFYSRPVTLSRLYPGLTPDKCTEIFGYYVDDKDKYGTQIEFSIEKNSEEFQKLCSLFYEKSYRRSLRNILPRGTSTHLIEPGDFLWSVQFYFEDPESPDEGTVLRFYNWFGKLEISLGAGTPRSYYISEQKVWVKEVLDIIQKTPEMKGLALD